jgi:hypothetical protein
LVTPVGKPTPTKRTPLSCNDYAIKQLCKRMQCLCHRVARRHVHELAKPLATIACYFSCDCLRFACLQELCKGYFSTWPPSETHFACSLQELYRYCICLQGIASQESGERCYEHGLHSAQPGQQAPAQLRCCMAHMTLSTREYPCRWWWGGGSAGGGDGEGRPAASAPPPFPTTHRIRLRIHNATAACMHACRG